MGWAPDVCLRRLILMVEEKTKHDLDGSAVVASIVASANSKKSYSPADFNPYREDERPITRLNARTLGALTDSLTGRRKRG